MSININGQSPLEIKGKSTFRTKEEAEASARLRQGSEIVVKEGNVYKLYDLKETNNVNTLLSKKLDDFDPQIVSFSMKSEDMNVARQYNEQVLNIQQVFIKNSLKNLVKITGMPEEQVAKSLGFKGPEQMLKVLKDIPPDNLKAIFNQINTLGEDYKTKFNKKIMQTALTGMGGYNTLADAQELVSLRNNFSNAVKGIMVNELTKSINSLYTNDKKPAFKVDPGLAWQPQELGILYNNLYNLRQGCGPKLFFDKEVTFHKTKNMNLDEKSDLTQMFNSSMKIASTGSNTIYIAESAITGDLSCQVRDIFKKKLFITQNADKGQDLYNSKMFDYIKQKLTDRFGGPQNINRWQEADRSPFIADPKQITPNVKERSSLYMDMLDQFKKPESIDVLKSVIVDEMSNLKTKGDPEAKNIAEKILKKLPAIQNANDMGKLFSDKGPESLSRLKYEVFLQINFNTEKNVTTSELQKFLNLSRPQNTQIKTDGNYNGETLKAIQQFQLDQTLGTFETKIKEKILQARETGNTRQTVNYNTMLQEIGHMRKGLYDETVKVEDVNKYLSTMFLDDVKTQFGKMYDWATKDKELCEEQDGPMQLISDMSGELVSMGLSFYNISSKNMDNKTVNTVFSNWLGVMKDGKSNLLDNLVTHEFGHQLQSMIVCKNTNGEEMNLTKEWKKIEGFNISKSDGVTDTWAPEKIDSFSVYGKTSRNEDIAECFRGYTPLNNDLKHPMELMRTSAVKFLTIDTLAGRYDNKDLMSISILAFGSEEKAKRQLTNTFMEISGTLHGKNFKAEKFSPEFIAKIFTEHKTLINDLHVLDKMKNTDPKIREALNKAGFIIPV